MKFDQFLTRVVTDCIEGPEPTGDVNEPPCIACEGERGEHEPGCPEDPDREPSDDDMERQCDGVWNGVEAERRSLRDAGRDRGGW